MITTHIIINQQHLWMPSIRKVQLKKDVQNTHHHLRAGREENDHKEPAVEDASVNIVL